MDSLQAAVALLLLTSAAGCGGQMEPAGVVRQAAPAVQAPNPPAPVAAAADAGGAQLPAPALAERKIIFSGALEIEVRDFATAHRELLSLLQQHEAYFAKSEIRTDSGQKRIGVFTIKVPAGQFQALVDALAALGEPLRNSTDSQDVTEEYVDIEARVKNLKAEEEVFNQLLKEAGTRLEEVFRIREQIRQNREQIERAEARLHLLGKLTSLSTITLTLRDRQEFIPPTAAIVREPPTFAERAAETFATSFAALRSLAEGVLLCLIALAPWLPVLAVAVLVGWRCVRWLAQEQTVRG